MTREEIENKIAEYKEYIEDNEIHGENLKLTLLDLEQELKKLEVKVYRNWTPKEYEKYYFINHEGKVDNNYKSLISSEYRLKSYDAFGIFQTEEEAKEIYEQHMAMEEYKHKLSILNNGWFPDWKNDWQEKGYLQIGGPTFRRGIEVKINGDFQFLNDYEYFNPKIADQVIKELGELWLKGKGIK